MADPSRTAQDGQIVIELPAFGTRIETFRSYSFTEHFMQPSDGWQFVIGDESVSQSLLAQLTPGVRVTMKIDGHITSTGFIDSVAVTSGRSEGTQITINGRDWLSPAVDSCIDPFTTKFNAGQTLFDVVSAALGPFGVSTMSTDNDVNLNVITGQARGKPTSKRGRPLKSFTIHQLKPYPQEGAFQFASRISERFGLMIWPSADGSFAIIGAPFFDQEPRYRIQHKIGLGSTGDRNNFVSGEVVRDSMSQPSLIMATAESAGGEVDRAKLKVVVLNELVAADRNGAILPSVQAILSNPAHKSAKVVPFRSDFATGIPFVGVLSKPQFIYDNESKSLEQLEHFAKREMAMRQHRAIVATYTLEGHMQNGQPWAVDTIVDVDDDYGNIHGPMWVLSRTFTKSRTDGTRTRVELVLPHTIVL